MRLLLDIHINPRVARALASEGIDVVSLRDWRAGDDRDAADERILIEALVEDRVLVTYDQHTVPDIVSRWASTDQKHAGVIIVDKRTVPQDDIGGLIRAIRDFVVEQADADW